MENVPKIKEPPFAKDTCNAMGKNPLTFIPRTVHSWNIRKDGEVSREDKHLEAQTWE